MRHRTEAGRSDGQRLPWIGFAAGGVLPVTSASALTANGLTDAVRLEWKAGAPRTASERLEPAACGHPAAAAISVDSALPRTRISVRDPPNGSRSPPRTLAIVTADGGGDAQVELRGAEPSHSSVSGTMGRADLRRLLEDVRGVWCLPTEESSTEDAYGLDVSLEIEVGSLRWSSPAHRGCTGGAVRPTAAQRAEFARIVERILVATVAHTSLRDGFDWTRAAAALDRALTRDRQYLVRGTVPGRYEWILRFAPNGVVTSVRGDAPESAAGALVSELRRVQVPPFHGEPVEVPIVVSVD